MDNSNNPNVVVQPCDSNSLTLYWDSNDSGDTICFDGVGSTDLTSYCAPWDKGGCLLSWNDQASSYASADVDGTVYVNIGDSGQGEGYWAFTSTNYDGVNGHLPNDSASSVNLNSCKAYDNLGQIADTFISQCRRGSIRRVFPSELLYWTLGQINSCSQSNCRTAWKLLNDSRFTK